MPIDFPSSPQLGDTYSSGGTVWTWDGTAWVGSTAPTSSEIVNLNDLADVNTSGQATGKFLYYNGSYWIPGNAPAQGLDDLTDVAIANAASGDVLYRTVDGWQNQALVLNHLSDVDGAAVYGQVLAYNGSGWAPRDPNILRPYPSTYLELGNATYTVNRNWSGCLAVLTNAGVKTVTLPNDSTIPVGSMFWLSPLNASATLTGAQGVTIIGATSVSPGQTILVWKQAAAAWITSANAPNTVQRYQTTIGNGVSSSFTITHNFGTRDVMVCIYRASDAYDEVAYDLLHTSTNTVVAEFSSPPAENSYRVVVMA